MGQALTVLEMWMASNRLCLNSTKTKFMWLGTQQQLAKLDLSDISAAFPNNTCSSSARDLGVILDQELSIAPHLNRLTRDCLYQLRHLRTVDRSLSIGAPATFVTLPLRIALTIAYSSILDYHLSDWLPLTVSFALRHVLLAKLQSSVMHQVTC